MRQKRPLFLLEVVIAIALVGFFSVYFLRSSLHHLYKEREGLLDLEFEWKSDLKKMEILSSGWPKKGVFNEGKVIKVPFHVKLRRDYQRTYLYQLCLSRESETAFQLKLKERRRQKNARQKTYYFFAKK
jgi:hypothetical protein